MLAQQTYGDPAMEDAEHRGAESFARAGFGSGSGPARLDTGHLVQAGYSPDSGWEMHVFHPASEHRRAYRKVISTSLGHDHDQVGEHALRFFRRPDVMSAMADQMQPGEWDNGQGGEWFERVHRHM